MLLLVLQRLLGTAIIDSVVKVEQNKPAGNEIWQLATGMLREIAIALIVYGLVAIVGSVLAGPSRVGVTVRRWLAPAFRQSVVIVYAVVIAIFLILLAWSPLGSDRGADRDARPLGARPVGHRAVTAADAARVSGGGSRRVSRRRSPRLPPAAPRPS